MLRIAEKSVLVGLMFLFGTSVSQAADPWREAALKAANRLADTVEVLDESLHEAYTHHASPAFKKAIEDIHHIEKVLEHLRAGIPAAPMQELCNDMHHLYEDLVQIRLDLIALGLQKNPKVVQTWNAMVHVYNNELNRFFGSCPRHPLGEVSGAKLELL